MLTSPGAAIERGSIGGTQSLRFAPMSKLTKYPPAVPTDFTNVKVEAPPSKKPRVKKAKNPTLGRFTATQAARNEFLSVAAERYRGTQTGPTGTDRRELPLSWDPVYTASYRPEVAGSAFEQSAGEVAHMSNLNTKDPKEHRQWDSKNSFLTPYNPNPYPIQVSSKFQLR